MAFTNTITKPGCCVEDVVQKRVALVLCGETRQRSTEDEA